MIEETQPDKRAPDPLRLVQQFVNSAELDEGADDLASPQALGDWMAARELADPGVTATDAELRRAIDVREGLRAVLFTHNGGARDQPALDKLERASGRAALRATFAGDCAPRLTPASGGTDAGLARLLGIVATAAADGTWERLKACADEGCRWAFYDKSKNRSGRWCSMATCGNQHKARAFRERSKASGD
jgi:predicted RNA-binding Zn ribbon-like protein